MSVAADIRAIRALTLDVWRGLTLAQRAALRRAAASYGHSLVAKSNGRTIAALHRHGFVVADTGPAGLTPMGRLVREVGLEADAAQARKRYSKRKAVRP